MSKEDDIIHFDFEKVKSYLDSDKVVIVSFLSLIKAELQKSLFDMEAQFHAKNLVLLKEAGHKLKGTGLSAALPQLTAIAIQMNKLNEFNDTHIADLLQQLKSEIAIVSLLVDAHTANLK